MAYEGQILRSTYADLEGLCDKQDQYIMQQAERIEELKAKLTDSEEAHKCEQEMRKSLEVKLAETEIALYKSESWKEFYKKIDDESAEKYNLKVIVPTGRR